VEGTNPHVANGAAWDQLALPECFADLPLGYQTAVRESMKNVYRRLMIVATIAIDSTIRASISVNNFVNVRESALRLVSVIFLFHSRHGGGDD
jgi:hypothetical protein